MSHDTRHVGLGRWAPSHLYIDDRGEVLCGEHMGVESTYAPQAWTDLGACTEVVVDGAAVGGVPGEWTLRCETCAAQIGGAA